MTNKEIMAKWNSFPAAQKNMPLNEFITTMKALTDPVAIRRDLIEIQRIKGTRRANKARIDRRLQDG